MSFAIDSIIYVASGRLANEEYSSTMLRYNATNGQWTESGTIPLVPRVNGAVCTVRNAAYMGLGFTTGNIHYDEPYLHDWWRYDPQTDTWHSLADFPDEHVVAAVCWTDGQTIYVGSGYKGYSEAIWAYDIATDSWSSAESKMPSRVMSAVSATCDGRTFYGTGFRTHSRSGWWEWHSDGQWESRRSVPGGGRHNAACAATDHSIWMFGGWYYGDSLTTGYHHDDILRYTLEDDQWTYCGTIPCGTMENGVACAIGNRVYFGLGEDKNHILHTHWYYIDD